MATVPIVTEVTKDQLDSLVANNLLNEGLQYKVTDKEWRLIAISNNTLNALTGFLNILITDSLPNYIIPDILIIDSGVVENDINIFTGTPLSFSIPNNYLASRAEFNVLTDGPNALSNIDFNGFYTDTNEYGEADSTVSISFGKVSALPTFNIAADGNGAGTSSRYIVTFIKAKLF